jgi:4-amino-4-deoxy-L-arabinose transferase-like glycosyltransferase
VRLPPPFGPRRPTPPDPQPAPDPSSPALPRLPFLSSEIYHTALVLVLLVSFLLQGLRAIVTTSLVYDEDLHIYAGYAYLSSRASWVNHQHPPLVKLVAAWPLRALPIKFTPPPPHGRQSQTYPLAADFFRANRALLDSVVLFARFPLLVLATALALLVYRWAKDLYGPRAALLALALYVFEPNVLGHSSIVFMDMPLTLFSFLTVYFFWRWASTPRPQLALCCALSLALALLTKFTALLLIPTLGLLWVIALPASSVRFLPLRGLPSLLAIHLAAIVFVLLAYSALFGVEPLLRHGTPSYAALFLLKLAGNLPFADHLSRAALWFASTVPLPALDYVRGIYWHLVHAKEGTPAFFFGSHSVHSWLHFHAASFLLKSTVPFLLLLGLRAALIRRTRLTLPEAFLLLPALGTLVFATLSSVPGGIRYLLPAYPFLMVFASRLAFLFPGRRALAFLIIGLITWHAASALQVSPHYIAYFNDFLGGPRQGYRYLVGSNLDFGQAVKPLARYLRARGNPKVYASLHTTIDPSLYGISYAPLPDDGRCRVGTLVISATRLQGVGARRPDAFIWLNSYRPSDVVGHAVFVYEVNACPDP